MDIRKSELLTGDYCDSRHDLLMHQCCSNTGTNKLRVMGVAEPWRFRLASPGHVYVVPAVSPSVSTIWVELQCDKIKKKNANNSPS